MLVIDPYQYTAFEKYTILLFDLGNPIFDKSYFAKVCDSYKFPCGIFDFMSEHQIKHLRLYI